MYTLLFIIIICLITNSENVIHPKGPVHRKLASECLMKIVENHFKYLENKPTKYDYILLLTIMITTNLSTPAFEIQNYVVKNINNLMKYQIEIINDRRHDFKPFSECLNCPTHNKTKKIIKRVPVEQYKSAFTLIIVDNEETFNRKMKILTHLKTFDPNQSFIVYFASVSYYFKKIAQNILIKFWTMMIINALVLIPKDLKNFALYRLELKQNSETLCGSQFYTIEIDKCINGNLINTKTHYFKYRHNIKNLNCTTNVITMPYEPFVINETKGIEMEILHLLGNLYNIKFNINLISEATDWGEKMENNTWNGPLDRVYKDNMLGVGNIRKNIDYMRDFDFTYDYYTESMVWIVPIAEPVPKWRVLFVIFNIYVWIIYITSIFLFGIIFWLVSYRNSNEYTNYRQFSNAFLTSFRISITNSTKSPKYDLTRTFFNAFAIFSIIISAVYTSSLIVYLKSPIASYQIQTTQDILQSNLGIGGLSITKQLFNMSSNTNRQDNTEANEIFQRFQTIDDNEKDTVNYWLDLVGKYRNMTTISSRFYVNYQLAIGNNVTTTADGKDLIYVCEKKPLMYYTLSIVMKKGSPFRRLFNTKIREIVEAGLIQNIIKKYQTIIDNKDDYFDELLTNNQQSGKPLTLDHLQGAFVIIIFGYLFAVILFISELFAKITYIQKCKSKFR